MEAMRIGSAQSNIECAIPAMPTGRYGEAQDDGSEIRCCKPMRRHPAEHSSLVRAKRKISARPLACNDKDHAMPNSVMVM